MPRQQLTFFNGHYDSWCYLPLPASVTIDRESEQYLCAAVLRAGNALASDGTLGALCRVARAVTVRGRRALVGAQLRDLRPSLSYIPSNFGDPACNIGSLPGSLDPELGDARVEPVDRHMVALLGGLQDGVRDGVRLARRRVAGQVLPMAVPNRGRRCAARCGRRPL